MQVDCHYQIQMENGLHPTHSESRRIRREGLAEMIIAVPEKYALEVGSPTPITSGRQNEQYLRVLDKLASKDNPTTEDEKYAEVLMTLIEAYEQDLSGADHSHPSTCGGLRPGKHQEWNDALLRTLRLGSSRLRHTSRLQWLDYLCLPVCPRRAGTVHVDARM